MRNYLAQLLKIPMVGKIFFVTLEGSTSSFYEEWLRTEMDVPAELIHTGTGGPASAYGEMVTDRNDVMIVFPGAYDIDTELAWAKNNTHMIGAGGTNVGGDYNEPNGVLYSDNIATAQILNLTGHNCQFHGINFANYGANAACLCAVNVNGYGNWFENCGIKGNHNSTQNAVAAAASLYISGAGMYPVFKDCQIGQDVWGNRAAANSGVIYFAGTARPNGGDFINCRILSCSGTATCAMVRSPGTTSNGRGWRWDNCVFANFDGPDANGTHLNQVFSTTNGQQESFLVKNCCAIGIDEWQDDDDAMVEIDMPVTSIQGGLTSEPSQYFGQ